MKFAIKLQGFEIEVDGDLDDSASQAIKVGLEVAVEKANRFDRMLHTLESYLPALLSIIAARFASPPDASRDAGSPPDSTDPSGDAVS